MKKHLLTAAVLIINCQLSIVNCFAQANLPGAGNCLSFNGTSDYVDVSSVGNYGVMTITYEAWINPLDVNNAHGIILRGNSSDNRGVNFGIYNGQIWIGGNDGGVWNNDFVGVVSVNTWTHLSAVYNQTTGQIIVYKNGDLVATVTHSFDIDDTNYTTFIGRNQASSFQFFNGSIDEVRIWNRALTQTEIRNNMCQKLTGSETGLVGYWRFDESSGTTANDSSPNGNNGTLK